VAKHILSLRSRFVLSAQQIPKKTKPEGKLSMQYRKTGVFVLSLFLFLWMSATLSAQTEPEQNAPRVPAVYFKPLRHLTQEQIKVAILPGVYKAPISLSFELPPQIELYYTKNNYKSSTRVKYTGPIPVDTVLNLQCWIKKDGKMLDTVYCGTYIVARQHTLPVISLSVVPASFFSPTGIYDGYLESNGHGGVSAHGNCWAKEEIDCFGEFFFNNEVVEDGHFGLKTHGNYTLGHPEKSLLLIAGKNYGQRYLEYKFFPDRPFNEYKGVIIRTSGNDQAGTRFKDVLISSIARDIGVDYMAFQPAILYVNGIYWGIHNLREKVSKYYLKYNHDADPDSTSLLVGSGNNSKDYKALIKFVKEQNQARDFVTEVEKRMDVDEYFNFSILQIFNANPDSRGNIKYWKAQNTDRRYHWIFYDGDCSAGNAYVRTKNFLADRLSPVETEWYNPESATVLLRSLVANKELKYRFINQYCLLLSTCLSADSLAKRLAYFKAIYEPEIPQHVKRRDNLRNETVNSWNGQVKSFGYFYSHMPARAYQQLKAQFTLGDTVRIKLSTSIPDVQTLKINQSCLRFSALNGLFFANLPLQVEATDENHLYRFTQWSDGDTRASRVLTIKKGMNYIAEYTPREPSDQAGQFTLCRFYASMQTRNDLEWLEIRNTGSGYLDLSGFSVYEDKNQWSYTFGALTVPANTSVIFTNDSAHFKKNNPSFKGSIIQSAIESVFHQRYRFVVCDPDGLLVDHLAVDFPDTLLLKKNHFLATRTTGLPEYTAWNNDKHSLDFTEEVQVPDGSKKMGIPTTALYWMAGVLTSALLVFLVVFIIRKRRYNTRIP
jgi:hypothetical protein